MRVRTVIVCEAQVPFVNGGAERHVRALVQQLRARGYLAEIVSLPFQSSSKEEILNHATAWRLINLSESNGKTIDLVIGTKFPSYFVRHPNKVTWLIHQHRAAYELCGTKYSDFQHTEQDVGLRKNILDLDQKMLGECRKIFSNSKNTAARLLRYNKILATSLYHPPLLADRLHGGAYGNYILSVGRLETVKRLDLVIEAMQHVDAPTRLVIVGEGSERQFLEKKVSTSGLSDKIDFLGKINDQDLIDLYAESLGIVYAPFDEDYGYITLEAFLSRKPVVTANDSGGTLEFVKNNINGFICAPEAEVIGATINKLANNKSQAVALGEAGYEEAMKITWDSVIERLVENEDTRS